MVYRKIRRKCKRCGRLYEKISKYNWVCPMCKMEYRLKKSNIMKERVSRKGVCTRQLPEKRIREWVENLFDIENGKS